MPTYKHTCPGLHCGGCHDGDGSGGWRTVVAVAVVLAVAGAVRAAWHMIVTALEVAVVVGLCAAGLAVAAGLAYAGYRMHQAVSARRSPAAPYRAEVIGVTPARRPGRQAPAEVPVLEPSRVFPAGWPWPAEGDPLRAGRSRGDVD